jgi:Protein of unknown function (DUF1488)
MSLTEKLVPAKSPRWDRNRVLFEIETEERGARGMRRNGERVECAMSREALQDASDRRHGKPAELLACFSKLQRRIERIALTKYQARSDAVEGLVTVWTGDLDD